jgi:protein gp37
MTGIQWTDETWNPTTGCDRVSPGCDNCYALTMAARLKGMGQPKYQHDGSPRTSGPGFGLTVHRDTLDLPFRWRKPRRVFVNSMSDLFHEDVPDGFIGSVFDVMAQTPQHTYQILTKRHGRMRSLLRKWEAAGWMWRRDDAMWCGPLDGPLPNVWLGVSAEDQKWADIRIPALAQTPALVRFVSAEPLLGPLDLRRWLTPETGACNCGGGGEWPHEPFCGTGPPDIDWLIVGGESGPGARPLDIGWVWWLLRQRPPWVPVFIKQLGSCWAREADPLGPRKGGDPEAWPEWARVREFPGGRPDNEEAA